MMARNFLIQLVLVLITVLPGWTSDTALMSFTQKDFARMIISEFNWFDGLPKEPSDRDYLIILGGKRNFHFEAENAYNPQTDNVTARNYELFGSFTGKQWLMGVSAPTTVHFTALLPLGGEFSIRANVKGEGFTWKFGDKKFSGGSSSSVFTKVDFGKVMLAPGVVSFEVTIPPEGAIDSFTLTAGDHKPIQPFGGWRFKEPLTNQRMAETGIALMDLYERLPDSKEETAVRITAVDAALKNNDVSPSTIDFLGPFSSRAWLRANYLGALVEIPIKISKSGFFAVRIRAMGNILSGSINDVSFSVPSKPYLDIVNLGIFRLEAGDNMIRIHLAPMGGLDIIELTPKAQSPSTLCALAGIEGATDRQVSADEARRFLETIRKKYPVRR